MSDPERAQPVVRPPEEAGSRPGVFALVAILLGACLGGGVVMGVLPVKATGLACR